MDPIFLARGEGHSVQNPIGEFIEFKVRAEQTAGALTAFESRPPPGAGPPLHVHADVAEAIYFVDGSFRLRTEDVVRDAPLGSFVLIPKGVPHTWQNVSDAPARLFVTFVPAAAGMEQFFEKFSAATGDTAMQDFATLAEAAAMKVLGPPLAQSHPLA